MDFDVKKIEDIRMLIMDLDGVFTDGTVMMHSDGSEAKRYSIQDGHAIKMWQRAGLSCAIISGRASKATTVRTEQLGIEYVFQGCLNKLPVFEQLLEDTGLKPEQVIYMGDDLMDMPVVKRAGFGVAVGNAVDELKEVADYITTKTGGDGAVREVIEIVLKSTGKWDDLMQRYLV